MAWACPSRDAGAFRVGPWSPSPGGAAGDAGWLGQRPRGQAWWLRGRHSGAPAHGHLLPGRQQAFPHFPCPVSPQSLPCQQGACGARSGYMWGPVQGVPAATGPRHDGAACARSPGVRRTPEGLSVRGTAAGCPRAASEHGPHLHTSCTHSVSSQTPTWTGSASG